MTESKEKIDAEWLLAQMGWVRRLALHLVGDESIADDVAQETWLAAHERAPAAPPLARMRGWLRTVAVNFARRRRRDERVHRFHELAAAEANRDTRTASGPGEEVARMRMQRRLADAILELPEHYRTAVILRYLDGLDYARIARRQEISEAAARQRVSRGLRSLRGALDREYGGSRDAWCLALLPLVRPSRLGLATNILTTGGAAVTIKFAVGVSVVMLGVVGLMLWGSDDPDPLHAASDSVRPLDEVASFDDDETTRDLAREDSGAAGRSPLVVGSAATSAAAEPALLDRERDLHGIVFGPDGAPFARASVHVLRDELREFFGVLGVGEATSREIATCASDEEGFFAIPLEPGRPYDLLVEAPGLAPTRQSGRYAGEYVEVRLQPGAILEGVVREVDGGAPVPGVGVTGRRFDSGYLEAAFTATTDDEGRYLCESLQPGLVRVHFETGEHAVPESVLVELKSGETSRVDVALEAGYRVFGRVVEAKSGLPVAGASVGEDHDLEHHAVTDARGEYALSGLTGSSRREIWARAPGFGATQVIVPPRGSDPVRCDLVLTRGGIVRGCLVGPDGDPVEDAYVAAIASDVTDAREIVFDWRSARSRADGCFEIDGLRTNLHHGLRIIREGLGALSFELPPDEHDPEVLDVGVIVLPSPGSLSGVVVDARGRRLPDVPLTLRGCNRDRNRWSGDDVRPVLFHLDSRDGRSDDLGRFSFADLAPGHYELSVTADEYVGSRPSSLEAELELGQHRRDLRLVRDARERLAGFIVDERDEPVAGATMMLRPESPLDGKGPGWCTEADGSFTFEGLRPGSYTIQVWPPRPTSAESLDGSPAPILSGVTLPGVDSGSGDLRIVLPPALSVTGRVVDLTGEPTVGAGVAAFDAEGKRLAASRTDAEGRFSLNLSPGAAITLRAGFGPPDSGRPYAIRPGVQAGDRDVELVLDATNGDSR